MKNKKPIKLPSVGGNPLNVLIKLFFDALYNHIFKLLFLLGFIIGMLGVLGIAFVYFTDSKDQVFTFLKGLF